MADITIAKGELHKLYEDALLGFIIADPEKLLEVSEILNTPDYFSDPNNRAAYEVFLKLLKEDRFPGAPALLIPELYNGTGKQHFASEDETARYVSALLDAPTVHAEKFNPREFVAYADHIKWEKDKRDLQSVGAEIISASEKVGVAEREEFISGIEDSLSDITMRVHGKDSLKHISDITGGLADQLDKLQRGESLGGGISTGIDMLDKTLNGLKGGELAVLAARPACGKSVDMWHTKILKYDGADGVSYVRIGDIKVGDYVYNRHGEPVEVLGVYPQGKLDAYELTFSDGRTAICSADHIWPCWQRTLRNGQHAEVIDSITLEEMLDQGINHVDSDEEGGPVRHNRARFSMPVNDAVKFPEQKHKVSPYAMGVLLGGKSKDSNGRFELPRELECHAKEVTEELLSSVRCEDKHIPEEYLLDSIENRWELLRGLMDASGGILKTMPLKATPVFSTISEHMAKDVRALCNSLGIIARITSRDRWEPICDSNDGEHACKSIEYSVQLIVPNELKLNLFTLEHKLQAVKEATERGIAYSAEYDRIRLEKVEKLPEKREMVCLMVDDPEHLFLCNDYLVTHNTTLSMQITYNVAHTMTEGKRNAVLIFSLEMMEDQLMSRMVATAGRVNMQAFMEEFEHLNDNHYYANTYSKQFEDKMQKKLGIQLDRARLAMDHIENLPIYTSTEAGMSPNSIKSLVMQKKREIERNGEHLALIVIDYLQLMVPGLSKANASRTEEVGDMSRKMKLLAKEFEVPVLLLAQLNRNADVTERPNLKDLRESGSIEQDADKVMFIWSENADKSPSDFPEYRDDAARMEAWRKEQMKVTITVSKNRQGETGDCPVIFDKGFQTFISQSSSYAANNEQYNEFAEKYYQKTRTTDLFWPLMEGEVPEELERFRTPVIREAPYLSPDGQLITLANDDGNHRAQMVIQSNPITPANQNVAPAQTASSQELDRSKPAPMPVVDDLETGFAELPDDTTSANDPSATSSQPLVEAPATGSVGAVDPELAEIADEISDDDDTGDASDIVFDSEDEDDELIDLDDLDVLEQLSEELKG